MKTLAIVAVLEGLLDVNILEKSGRKITQYCRNT